MLWNALYKMYLALSQMAPKPKSALSWRNAAFGSFILLHFLNPNKTEQKCPEVIQHQYKLRQRLKETHKILYKMYPVNLSISKYSDVDESCSFCGFIFIFLHLADAFIQSDLQCLIGYCTCIVHLYCQYGGRFVFWLWCYQQMIGWLKHLCF